LNQILRMGGTSLAVAMALAVAPPSLSQTISSISVANTSSPNPATEAREFLTQSTLGGVDTDDLRVFFGHRMAFSNRHIASGGIAQTNKRNVVYELSFTVEDPLEQGFLLRVDSLVRGISEIDWQVGGEGSASATGISLDARYDDSTDAPGSFSFVPTVFGQNTGGALVNFPERLAVQNESERVANLGPYTGSIDFVFRFTTATSPTTNVLFPNSAEGSGSVVYGLGELPPEYAAVDLQDLGHFLIFTAAFSSPCPADVNRDGAVDLDDLNMVLTNFGQVSLDGDATNDGVVDLDDLNTVLTQFGTACP